MADGIYFIHIPCGAGTDRDQQTRKLADLSGRLVDAGLTVTRPRERDRQLGDIYSNDLPREKTAIVPVALYDFVGPNHVYLKDTPMGLSFYTQDEATTQKATACLQGSGNHLVAGSVERDSLPLSPIERHRRGIAGAPGF